MKIKSICEDNKLTIFREKWGVIFFQFLIAVASIGMGSLFAFYVAEESKQEVFKWFGYLFLGLGILALLSLISRFNYLLKSNTGDILVEFSEEKIILSNGLGADINEYFWGQFKKIIFTDLFIDHGSEGIYKRKNYMIFIFNSFPEKEDFFVRSRKGISLNKEGEHYFVAPFPNREHLIIVKRLSEKRVQFKTVSELNFAA